MTVRQLISADTARLSATAREWDSLARRIGDHAAALDREVLVLQGHWTGTSAEAATALLARLCTELDSATPDLYAVGQAVAEHAATLARAQEIAVYAQATAGCYRITVADDGTATVNRTGDEPDPGDRAAADAVTGHPHRALSLAGGSDSATAARIPRASPDGGTGCRRRSGAP